MFDKLCTKLAFIASPFIGLFTTIYMTVCSNSFYFKSVQVLFKFSPVIAYVILTNSLDGTSFCNGGEVNAPSNAEAPSCDSASNSELSNSSVEEEKKSKKEYGLLTKVGICVAMFVTVVVTVPLIIAASVYLLFKTR
jgi:hypothetical protein